VSYNGPLWELQPVEVVARTRPAAPPSLLSAAVQQVLQESQVDEAALRIYLAQNNLALVITHNVTVRDDFDRQQPVNLRVPGGVQTGVGSGSFADVTGMQFFQGEQLRGWTGSGGGDPNPGRRVLARPMVDQTGLQSTPGAPAGSVTVAEDGSIAAFVPAGRATSWQLIGPAGEGVVRERYWLTFQAGEIRACGSCHGQNTLDQAGQPPPSNPPQALRDLLAFWKVAAGQGQIDKAFLPLVDR
jgi:Hydrazine synthase alpha subunit middle domain